MAVPAAAAITTGRMGGARPTHLSPREGEVLRRPRRRAGRTARSPRELFIGHRTAQDHVSHILGKLGVANRAEAAAVAVRDGLADPTTDPARMRALRIPLNLARLTIRIPNPLFPGCAPRVPRACCIRSRLEAPWAASVRRRQSDERRWYARCALCDAIHGPGRAGRCRGNVLKAATSAPSSTLTSTVGPARD